MPRPLNGKGIANGLTRYYEDGLEGSTICHRCEQIIFAGKPMYAKKVGNRNGSVRYYHKKCWEGMFID